MFGLSLFALELAVVGKNKQITSCKKKNSKDVVTPARNATRMLQQEVADLETFCTPYGFS
ncbi:MAG: hypothetical protein ABSE80_08970 [Halobacteriota archaeon]|jgi:hypothetical protein